MNRHYFIYARARSSSWNQRIIIGHRWISRMLLTARKHSQNFQRCLSKSKQKTDFFMIFCYKISTKILKMSTSALKMSTNVPKCHKYYKNHHECPQMITNDLKYKQIPQMFANVIKCPQMSSNVHKYSCPKISKNHLKCIQILRISKISSNIDKCSQIIRKLADSARHS